MRLKSIKMLKSVMMTADEKVMLNLIALILVDFKCAKKEKVKVRKNERGSTEVRRNNKRME